MAGRAVAEAFSLAASAAAVIWISRAVGPTNLGYYAVALVALQLGTIAVNAGLPSVGAQRVAQDKTAAVAAWRTVTLARLGIGLALLACAQFLLATTSWVPEVLRQLLTGMTIAWVVIPFSSEWVLIGRGQVRDLSAVRIASASVSAGLAILLIGTPEDVGLLPIVFVLPTVAVAVLSLFLVWRLKLSAASERRAPEWRSYFADAWHYLKGEVATFAYFSSDRLFLFIFAPPAVLGLYEAAYRLIQPFYAVATVVSDTMFLRLAETLNTDRFRSTFSRYVDAMWLVTIPVGFATTAFGAFFVTVVYGPSFLPASAYLQVLGWVITLGFTSGVVVMPFVPWGRAKPYGDAVTAGALVSLLLNAALIPPMGGIGAAIATVGAKAAVTLIGFRLFRKIVDYPIVVDFVHYAVASLGALAVSVALRATLALPEPAAIGLFGLVYLGLLIPLRSWGRETSLFNALLRRRLSR